jgi:hypothetical protein
MLPFLILIASCIQEVMALASSMSRLFLTRVVIMFQLKEVLREHP